MISSIDVLKKLPKADNMKDVGKLRKIYNSLETSVANHVDLGVEITFYGTLLISIIFDHIPTERKLLFSRHLRNNVFDLDILIEVLKKSLLRVKDFKLLAVIKIVILMKLITLQDIIGWIILKQYEKMKKIWFNLKSLCLLR